MMNTLAQTATVNWNQVAVTAAALVSVLSVISILFYRLLRVVVAEQVRESIDKVTKDQATAFSHVLTQVDNLAKVVNTIVAQVAYLQGVQSANLELRKPPDMSST